MPNTLVREALALAQSQEGSSKVFVLDHFPWRACDASRVILLRHVNPAPEPDDFTCHDAATGENLGWGEDKAEAQSNARHKLSERVRVAEGIA